VEDLERYWKRLYFGTLVLGFVVVCLGAWTRLADAGLGCPDWPGCYGQITVPDSAEEALQAYPDTPLEPGKALLEMVHRYAAGLLGLAILGLFILARFGDNAHSKRITAWLLILVVVQATLGALTVTMRLFPPIVLGHLLLGFTTIALLICLRPLPSWNLRTNPFKVHLSFAWFFLALQIMFGGWMSANYAALACPDFPTCQGEWWPPMNLGEAFNTPLVSDTSYLGGRMDGEGRTAIHMAHRLNAVLVLGVLLSFFLRLRSAPGAGAASMLGIWLLGGQLLLGVILVLIGIPLLLAVFHNLIALLLVLNLTHISRIVWRRPDVTYNPNSLTQNYR